MPAMTGPLPWFAVLASAAAVRVRPAASPDTPGTSMFPRLTVPFQGDEMGWRQHVIVTGPEVAATGLIHGILRNHYRFPKCTDGDLCSNGIPGDKKAAVYRYMQPSGWAPACREGGWEPPVFSALGVPRTEKEVYDRLYVHPRYFVNITGTVLAYRSQRQKVKIVQMVRDPTPTLLSKNSRQLFCSSAAAEQQMAYDLMVEVMDMPEVTTICYEQMVQEDGDKYLADKLSQFGVKDTTFGIDDDANIKWGEEHTCDATARAYMKLCPSSPLTATLKSMCS
mmetsp:Transcript_137660/g.427667  ORF Transcript_137660/g.427667 Transcript_137660/m.427667 type:complete len:280 (-) Transcript_137660:222-1061(-)